MFFQANRYIREIIIAELTTLFNEHPFYGLNTEKKFDREPLIIADTFSPEGRQYPAIIVKSTSAKEYRLAIDKFIEEVSGHVRIQQMLPHIIAKIEDDKEYAGVYPNAVVKLEFVNILRANKRQLVLRITTQPESGAPVVTYCDNIAPKQWRTDIIPGAKIFFNSFNDFELGKAIYVDVFADKQYLGDLYGTGYDTTINLEVYAGTTYEAEELIDMLTGFFIFLMPQRLNFGHGIVTKTASNTNVVTKDGKLGEEFYKAGFEISMFMEHHFFIPQQTITGYSLWIEMREHIDQPYAGFDELPPGYVHLRE